ncbi:hypothetical protein [Marivita geojedonensis]|uniref:hypothetical protein n=1 Tax=Marivita geojedonensis TaxID=1123756 RepID=UPI000A1E12AF|nr:hypothetical protein [Marivita geojedonensis]PRY75562.1 hypothetical protein CLV76_11429 [Marivita geojedonensis]
MPVTAQIIPDHNLVYVRYTGAMLVSETAEALAEFAKHPLAGPGLRHLVDLTRLTDIDRDYAKFMELQATKLETMSGHGIETFMVYYATTPIGLQAANLGKNGWTPESGVVAIVLEDEEHALHALGVPYASIETMLARVDAQNV